MCRMTNILNEKNFIVILSNDRRMFPYDDYDINAKAHDILRLETVTSQRHQFLREPHDQPPDTPREMPDDPWPHPSWRS